MKSHDLLRCAIKTAFAFLALAMTACDPVSTVGTPQGLGGQAGQGGLGGQAGQGGLGGQAGQGGLGGSINVCGDGVLANGEACDDGNVNAADGCSTTCSIETGYTCSGAPSVCTDIDECATNQDDCGANTNCINTLGSFQCVCVTGFGDCDNDPINGCEINLATSADHCGMCNSDCSSGFCVDGVCCDSACTDSCKACNVPGSEGTCTETSPGACSAQCSSGHIGFPSWPFIQGPPQSYGEPVAADMNGDGYLDIVAGSIVIINENGGGFATGYNYRPDNTYGRVNIPADVDGDGAIDIISKSANGTNLTGVWRNLGNATFAPEVDYPSGNGSIPEVAADINGDGHVDIVGRTSNQTLSILFNQGNGTFGPVVEFPATTSPGRLVGADFNKDGATDIAFSGGGTVYMFLNQGNGTFGAPIVQNLSIFGSLGYVFATDLNRDGYVDYAGTDSQMAQVTIYAGDGTGMLSGPIYSGVGGFWDSYPNVCAAGDLNGDGRLDLALAHFQSNTAYIRVGLNNTGFDFTPVTHYAFSGIPQYMTAADFDNDGRADLVVDTLPIHTDATGKLEMYQTLPIDGDPVIVADLDGDNLSDVISGGSNVANVWLNQGGATFGGPSPCVTPGYPRGFKAVDLNGDGMQDFTALMNDKVSVFINGGAGNFGVSTDYAVGTFIYGWRLTDVNGDARPDLMVTTTPGLGVALNAGNGTFGSFTYYAPGILGPVVDADVNSDGLVDLVVAKSDLDANKMALLLNQGNGAFVRAGDISFGAQAGSMAGADFDGDGLRDIVVAAKNLMEVRVLHNNGNASFAAPVVYQTWAKPQQIAIIDMNRDGIPDFVAATPPNDSQYGTRFVTFFVNNGDGTFRSREYITGSISWSLAVGDLNGDGAEDVLLPGTSGMDFLPNTCLP